MTAKRVTIDYNALNQRTKLTRYQSAGSSNLVASTDYTYDDHGNRTSRTETATGKATQYAWDHRNRLIQVIEHDGESVTGQVDYAYDAFNRLVKRTVDADGDASGGSASQYWAYDEGINAVVEFDGPSASDLSHRYLWSDRVDELLADEQVTSLSTPGDTLYALSDHLGTIRDIANFNESTSVTSVTNHRTYNSFGKLVAETNAAVDLIFGFTGKQLDDATGLQHNLFRWYDSELGQWLSEDPLGFAAGDENVRRYVGNEAATSVDPNGLEKRPPVPLTREIMAKINLEMLRKGLEADEIRFRLQMLKNVYTGKVVLPTANENGGYRDPELWTETPDGYIPAGGYVGTSITALWDDGHNAILCQKYSKLIILKTVYDLSDSLQRKGLDEMLRNKILPNDLGPEERPWRTTSSNEPIDPDTLLPGDQIWIKNPTYDKVNPDFWGMVYPNPPSYVTNPKEYTYRDHYEGEEGSNLFYFGAGMVMSIYTHELYKLDDYKYNMINGGNWNTNNDWKTHHPDKPLDISTFQIYSNSSPVAGWPN